MTKFNKGDKVRLTPDWAPSKGTEGIVTGYLAGSVTFTVTKGKGYAYVGQSRTERSESMELIEEVKPAIATHYAAGMPEGIDALAIMKEQGWQKEFMLGSILKYITRCQHKGQYLKDLKKIQDYATKLIALEES